MRDASWERYEQYGLKEWNVRAVGDEKSKNALKENWIILTKFLYEAMKQYETI